MGWGFYRGVPYHAVKLMGVVKNLSTFFINLYPDLDNFSSSS
jgi:hypothetical protein